MTLLVALILSFFPTLSPTEMQSIGNRIWQNECAMTIKGLTSWNQGEEFASMGIGHFIWFPQSKKQRFIETFPSLVIYLQNKGATIPEWLQKDLACPWNSRQEFQDDLNSEKMVQLRSLLKETIELQTAFILEQFDQSLLDIEKSCDAKNRARIHQQIERLASTPQGVFALIDYVNFKGTGISTDERYGGNGWGLLQVLQTMNNLSSSSGSGAVADFVLAAKHVLNQRVENSPPERNEKRWLSGWNKRLESYLAGLTNAI
ncbi:MAG: hypothetical protein JHC93_02905 [Parachlamydiales bacterium]|nr:hypothetical protein [Parachlamydiales bacterium]